MNIDAGRRLFDGKSGLLKSIESAVRYSLRHNLHSLVALSLQFGEPAVTREHASAQNCDAIAEHFNIREYVSRKEDRLAFFAQRHDDVANFAPPDRIKPRH